MKRAIVLAAFALGCSSAEDTAVVVVVPNDETVDAGIDAPAACEFKDPAMCEGKP